ncbi:MULTISPECIES: TetR/AcrR family transcriptional regulator [Actinokineospora]|jgi:AcrR family transcriptional regulator|uniref:DNA-binding transcriptional regulator, AcrR family n=2 Tax=Actinokineospora TaxID=39845 RepID=A0A1H0VZ82_9PSEU|nr:MULTISPECIES: TetR/AcrR family transcriptional regulator [Actinokineospora]MBC6450409.1 TetR/AcrR family transcriptional regulator [Actinokineospora xionganensis]TDP67072.1 TetR family transcriptional regulator [Actinokineospora alba]SDJ47450.1 DNA-binding transcriptional regulator, AcrR family [Actinokineospora alba]SDP83671.1 DNA-binding transcriptional regulator, AcrR family [Actinokineospora alba]
MSETIQQNGVGRGARLPRTARRAQLLAAAQDVFAANGYHAAGMDEIAERAGVSKPVLYQHFPGKLELYMALLEKHVDELIRRVNAAMDSTTDNKVRVRNAVGAYFDFVDGESQAFRLVFESDLRGEPLVSDAIDRATTASVDAITATITADAGLDVHRARLLAVGLVGVSQVAARAWLEDNRAMPKDEAIALISNLAWRGIGGGFPLQPHD